MRIVKGTTLTDDKANTYDVRLFVSRKRLASADTKKLLHSMSWVRSRGFGQATLTNGYGEGSLLPDNEIGFDEMAFGRAAEVIEYRCPKCSDNDPPVTSAVVAACGIGDPHEVAIKCPNGHWAAYPCEV